MNFKIALLIIVVSICFLPTLSAKFTNWDETLFITENKDIRQLNGDSLKSFFLTPKWGFYKPLVLTSFAIEYHFAGLSPFLYHLDNLIIHVINVILVYYLFTLLAGEPIGWMVALLFGIHPMHVESVAWVVERKDVLNAMFFLVAMIAYVKYKAQESRSWYYLSFITFILSFMCKPMGVSLPFVFILLDSYLGKRKWLDKIPFLAFLPLAVLWSMMSLQMRHHGVSPLNFTWVDKFFIAGYGLQFYITKVIFPFGLSCFYPYPDRIISIVSLGFLGYLATFVIIKKNWFGGLFFLITLFPALQFISNNPAIVCDRYTYLPYLGLFFILAQILKEKPVWVLVFVLLLCPLTYQRCKVWQDSITLWTNVIDQFPNGWFPYVGRGMGYIDEKKYIHAIEDLSKSMLYRPSENAQVSLGAAYNDLGYELILKKDYKNAIFCFDRASLYCRRTWKIYANRAVAYRLLGDKAQALADYKTALSYVPQNDSHFESLKKNLPTFELN